MRFIVLVIGLALFLPRGAQAWRIEVPNSSFEEGRRAPAGWKAEGKNCRWLKKNGAEGRRAIAAHGSGLDTSYWRSGPVPMAPSSLYFISFMARGIEGGGGTPITGPVFCNRDLGGVPSEWREYSSLFFTPREFREDNWIRFGQWHVDGGVAYDSIRIAEALPLYAAEGRLELGEGERIDGKHYLFEAPFGGESRNHSRPLVQHLCDFNTNRWVFGKDSSVVYRHGPGDFITKDAVVEIGLNWRQGGDLIVDARTVITPWREIGTASEVGVHKFPVPESMLPSPVVYVRLRSRSANALGPDSDPGSFQVNAYTYRARMDGDPVTMTGRTRYLTLLARDEEVNVNVTGLGDCRPGGKNFVMLETLNTRPRAAVVVPVIRVRHEGKTVEKRMKSVILRPVPSKTLYRGHQILRLPYKTRGTGEHTVNVSFEGTVTFEMEFNFRVTALDDASYGELLPDSTPEVGLWWTSSGRKVGQVRPRPETKGHGIRIRAARNEAEAAQFVLRPERDLAGLEVRAGALAGPNGAEIPGSSIDILRVRYVPVERTTDSTGTPAPWPDPLPPLKGRLNLKSGRNHPFWVRVRVPREARQGTYSGRILVAGEHFAAEVPLKVEVYGFGLPDRMTLTTAFGFSPGNVWRYQRINNESDRRLVLELYLKNLAAHHISPYDPAPLDPFLVTWPGSGDWAGGVRDFEFKKSGRGSLLVEDATEKSQPSARYVPRVPIPEKGLRVRFDYRTGAPGHRFIVGLSHHDDAGQWMSGRNHNITLTGDGTWQGFDATIDSFPPEARSVSINLYACEWSDDGSPTGKVWYDELRLTDAGTGEELVKGGDFEPLDSSALRPSFDWSEWDAAMHRAINEHHFNSFAVPIQGMGGGTFHSRTEPSLLGYAEDTPEYRAAFNAYCREVQEHLREKGWLKDAFVYWFDEPDRKDYEFVMNGFRKLEENAPDLGRMLTEQIEPALIGGPNIWCPVSPSYQDRESAKRRKKGEKIWWYICVWPPAPYAGEFIDHAAPELRVWLWQTFKRGIDGILIWQTNYWTSAAAYPDSLQDPYQDPMSWMSGYSTPAGTKSPWGNGDGRFIYPPEDAADGTQDKAVLEGPVDSIRWEHLRDGIEDYEYLVMLGRLLKEKRGDLSRRERARYRALLEVPETITRNLTGFSHDPGHIESRRDSVARAIERLAAD